MIDDVKAAGFNAVRIPVTWSQHIDDANGYAIDEAWLSRVQEVVDYVIDNDMYCILNVHHDVGGNSWLKASESNIAENGGKSAMDGMLYNVYTHFTSKGIPVILGEFGAHNKDNESDRADYAGYLVENAKKYGIKCFWWDAGGKIEADSEFGYYKGMALYDRNNGEWIFPEIVKAITGVDVTNLPADYDVNADKAFDINDVADMQRFILGEGKLADWQTGDLFEDNKIDSVDLLMMKRQITKKS